LPPRYFSYTLVGIKASRSIRPAVRTYAQVPRLGKYIISIAIKQYNHNILRELLENWRKSIENALLAEWSRKKKEGSARLLHRGAKIFGFNND